MEKENKSGRAKRIALAILCVLLALILAALIGVIAWGERLMNMIDRTPDNSTISQEEYEEYINNQTEETNPDFTGETIDPGDVEWGEKPEAEKHGEHIVNIMLIGQDRRPGEGRTRSDVMILCTVNKNTKELTMTSFMRDMYVQIPGYDDNRMNACYAFGGMKLLESSLKTNFGVYVDGNIEVDFGRFTDVIDLVGGVDINLSKSEANYMMGQGFSVSAGMNHLNGETALAYARNRSIGNGDFSRTERQRKVLSAVIQKCKGMSVSQLNNLAEKVLPLLKTDLSNKEILAYMADMIPLLGELKVTSNRIPVEGSYKYASIRGMSVLVPDIEKNRAALQEILK